jgi:hypothetical protein
MTLSEKMYEDSKSGGKALIESSKDFVKDNAEHLRQFGLTMVYIKASILIFFSSILFIFGLIFIFKEFTKTKIEADGTVTESKCTQNIENIKKPKEAGLNDFRENVIDTNTNINMNESNFTYDCKFKVKFIDSKEKEHTVDIETTKSKQYSNDEKIKIYYDSNEPTKSVSIDKDSNQSKIILGLMIFFGLIGIIYGSVWIYLSKNFSVVAQVEGAKVGFNLVTDIFQK